jgi:hypothetical protein
MVGYADVAEDCWHLVNMQAEDDLEWLVHPELLQLIERAFGAPEREDMRIVFSLRKGWTLG